LVEEVKIFIFNKGFIEKLYFCNSSENWEFVSQADKERINFNQIDNGELYLCWQDFRQHFDNVEVFRTRMPPAHPGLHRVHRRNWLVDVQHGEIVEGLGDQDGEINDKNTSFWHD